MFTPGHHRHSEADEKGTAAKGELDDIEKMERPTLGSIWVKNGSQEIGKMPGSGRKKKGQ